MQKIIKYFKAMFQNGMKVDDDLQLRIRIEILERENIHLKKSVEALYRESTRLGHITKDTVQLMCMEALQVPR